MTFTVLYLEGAVYFSFKRLHNFTLIGANNKKLDCIGYVTSTFTWCSKQSEQIFYVCNDVKIALLGKPAIKRLGIVKVNISGT